MKSPVVTTVHFRSDRCWINADVRLLFTSYHSSRKVTRGAERSGTILRRTSERDLVAHSLPRKASIKEWTKAKTTCRPTGSSSGRTPANIGLGNTFSEDGQL